MTQSHQPSDLYGGPCASQLTAVLGPTNTGKTHLAIERMLGHQSGLIGLPLRLLAREVYDRIVAKIGPSDVALITGEEKIKPKNARYWVSTVEAMPRDLDVEFVAIDEVQLAADPERGHVFTDRLFHARGRMETLLLGAETMRTPLSQLLMGVNFISRPRLSQLTYAGPKKISRLPRRTAIVAFSARNVYEIAEFVRRQRGGAAVVLGALSPRTRNAQVEMFQSGDVDYLVATDAIGMGLNLDVHHVAFAGNHKFDGSVTRALFPHEAAQIAGRAGRHIKDGTFGVTGEVPPFSAELINMIEAHEFEPVTALQWRAGKLDYSGMRALLASLRRVPNKDFLMMARDADDVRALEAMAGDDEIRGLASNPQTVRRTWEVCQVPDYRKISPVDHHDLVRQLLGFVLRDEGLIPEDWIAEQINQQDRVDGDIDTIAARIAYIRTWTFVANRPDWLSDPVHWQETTRAIEDKLSDALHEGLTKRFVDQRTSTLMKRLRENDDLFVEIDKQGQLMVEDHFVGELRGFSFTPDHNGGGDNGRAARAATAKVLSKELMMRANDMIAAGVETFQLSPSGEILWNEAVVGQLGKGDHILRPRVTLLADEQLAEPARGEAEARLNQVVTEIIADRLAPLVQLEKANEISGLARGVAFQLVEQLGVLRREPIANDIRQLDQEARGQLRKFGVRFGAFHVYFPLLLKPGASELSRLLWSLYHERLEEVLSFELPRAGLTSAPLVAATDAAYYLIAGFSCCGQRVVRVDMLERLADLIRPLVAYRAGKGKADAGQKPFTNKTGNSRADAPEAAAQKTDAAQAADNLPDGVPDGAPDMAIEKVQDKVQDKAQEGSPDGATGNGGFIIQPEMMSIMGCSADELGEVLRSIGFQAQKVTERQGAGETEKASDAGALADGALNGKAATSPEPDVKTEKGAETEAEGESGGAAAEVSEAEAGVVEVLIWRPRKKGGAGKRKPTAAKRGGKAAHKKGGQRRPGGPKREKSGAKAYGKPKPAKAFDPDSPFAKLAQLKDNIGDKP